MAGRASAGSADDPPNHTTDLQADFKIDEARLAQLSGRLLQLHDEERRRVARQLHSHAGQSLSALNINLSMVLSTAGKLSPRVREALQESVELADECVREIRKLSYELHPPLLDEMGLVSALRAYTDAYSRKTGIQLDLRLPAGTPRLTPQAEVNLFRIVEEGLDNIHLHSGSSDAILALKLESDKVELELIDHGRGLPATPPVSFGIAGMQERARQMGGRLTIASGPNGTILRVLIPA